MPWAVMEDANHAYVPIIDCIADLLGHGFDVERIGG